MATRASHAAAAAQVVCSDAEQLRLAELECDLMRKRFHPNIIALLDTQAQRLAGAQHRHALYMLMPLYSEGSLWDAMQRRGAHFSNAEILSVVTQARHPPRGLCTLPPRATCPAPPCACLSAAEGHMHESPRDRLHVWRCRPRRCAAG